MRDVLLKLDSDFFSTIVFAGVYFATGNIALAAGSGIAGAILQVIHVRIKQLGFMTSASRI